MKRYIRTKNGMIFENIPLNSREIEEGLVIKGNKIFNKYWYEPSFEKFYVQYDEIGTIEKEADTIEELIMVGDLVCFDGFICYVYIEKGSNRLFVWYPEEEVMVYLDKNYDGITELYTKQGNNYILVARKENGEWRVL